MMIVVKHVADATSQRLGEGKDGWGSAISFPSFPFLFPYFSPSLLFLSISYLSKSSYGVWGEALYKFPAGSGWNPGFRP